jgi:rhodanese-related sulfurtransferase
MSVKQISVQEAHDILTSDPKAIYVDVRTEQEYRNGHVPGARNIVAFNPDPATNRMAPNPDFLKSVEGALAKDARIIVGCQAGGRSQQAALIMEQAGFTDVSNMQGGFGGARDPMGRVVTPGWLQSNFPVER